jgi:hypothetical protein
MKTKSFDCVAMKRAGAAKVYEKVRGMTFRQKVRFWRDESAALLQDQQAAKSRRKPVRSQT